MAKFAAGARLLRNWLRRKPHSGERLARSAGVALRTMERAMAKAGRVGGLRDVVADLATLGRLIKAWAKRDYRQVSRATIVLSLGAVAYLLSPLDAIFDFIPVLGFVDDAAVLGWVLREIRGELVAFRAWEDTHKAPTPMTAVPVVATGD